MSESRTPCSCSSTTPTGSRSTIIGSPPSLQVEVIFGNQTSPPLDLEPSFDPDTGLGTHGEFDAAIIPTAVGNYTFHFFGTVAGQQIDERFTSGPTTFATVDDPTGIEFPTKVPTLPDLGALADRLSPRVDRAVSAAAASADQADTAHTLALVAVIVGAVGLLAGVVLGGGALILARRGRRRPPQQRRRRRRRRPDGGRVRRNPSGGA